MIKTVWKKWTAICLAAAMTLVLCSCGEQPPDLADMTSQELVDSMKIGWNLGDTLDVCIADRDGDGRVNETPPAGEAVDETLWGNVRTTPELFQHLKEDGINAVRIPVTWRDHLSNDGNDTINEDWMNRVQEIVDDALAEDMYVILNLHHDGGGDPAFGAWIRTDYDGFEDMKARYVRVWEQIAERFQDYDERLIFESMNEVGFDRVSEQLAFTMLNTLNQTFVDLIRGSGGNNPNRHLLIAGYWTDIQETCKSAFQMPEDPKNRCILSVHYYTPYQFCIASQDYTWGADGDVEQMKRLFQQMHTNFVEKGVPVIVGEYGTTTDREQASRVYFYECLNKICDDYGMATFLWDNGSEYNRETFEWKTEGVIEALQRATSGKDYTPEKQG